MFEIKNIKSWEEIKGDRSQIYPMYKIEEFVSLGCLDLKMTATLNLINREHFSELRTSYRIGATFNRGESSNRYPLSHFLFNAWRGNISDFKDILIVPKRRGNSRVIDYYFYRLVK